MRYAVIFEKSSTGYGAYVPDLPGCIATADTVDETRRLIREAIELHLDDMRATGQLIPQASSICEYAEKGEHMLPFTKAKIISLKNHPEFDEKWVGDRISEDPTILGLGNLVLLDRERQQARAGRLDLLFEDEDGEERYEVELMLGATDESHVIRCIEYWDIERRRFPAYEHCAVLVAEDVTARFLNVLSLIASSIPLVAIQLTALEIEGKVSLVAIKVLDTKGLLREDVESTPAIKVDRRDWTARAPKTVEVVENCLALINEKSGAKFSPNFNKYYIGLLDGARGSTFISFMERRNGTSAYVSVRDVDTWVKRLHDAGMRAKATSPTLLRVSIDAPDLDSGDRRAIISELFSVSVRNYRGM
jgi:predicted RNase H-like HicB family nuclease